MHLIVFANPLENDFATSVAVGSTPNQPDPARPLCLLRHCGKPSVIAQGLPNRGALLAQNAAKPQPGRQASHLGDLQQDQGEMSVAASKTATSLRKAAGPRSAVNHLSKSVVRDTEGAAKQKPHATFCGNRGRATAPGDPVAGVQSPCATRP